MSAMLKPVRLRTVEEHGAEKSGGYDRRHTASDLQLHVPRCRSESKANSVVSGSSGVSNVSGRIIGVNSARRPSDNLLLQIASHQESDDDEDDDEDMEMEMGSDLDLDTPSKRVEFVKQTITVDSNGISCHKSARPTSDNSITSNDIELFSPNPTDLSSGSSTEDDFEDHHNTSMMSNKSNASAMNPPLSMDAVTPQIHNAPVTTPNATTPAKFPLLETNSVGIAETPKARYMFSNVTRTRSQSSLVSSGTSSPLRFTDGTPLQNNRQLPSTSKTYSHSNSTSAILPASQLLTPSHRYRLRRELRDVALKNSIKQKEKFYEEQDMNLDLKDDSVDATLIWNIPVASYSTSSFLNNTKSHHRDSNLNVNVSVPTNNAKSPVVQNRPGKFVQAQGPSPVRSQLPCIGPARKPLNSISQPNLPRLHGKNRNGPLRRPPTVSSLEDIPATPIPGLSNMSDTEFMQETIQNLSAVYLHTQEAKSRGKLDERRGSTQYLPMLMKEMSDRGMEDLVLVSEKKLEAVSSTRPSYLPPKSLKEKKSHEHQIAKYLSMASTEQLERKAKHDKKASKNKLNGEKYHALLERGITRKSSLHDLKKLVWETPINDDIRLEIYHLLLESDARLISGSYVESFDYLKGILDGMDFPADKLAEIQQIINKDIKFKIGGNLTIKEDLFTLLKLKSISKQGISVGDALIFHYFLYSKSFKNMKEIWEITNVIQMTCFNDICREKYDHRIVEKRGITARILRNPSFKSELNNSTMNFTTLWNIFTRVDNSLFMWLMDIIVVENSQCFTHKTITKEQFKGKNWESYFSKNVVTNYRILASFTALVLLDYHFGFNDLKQLENVSNKNFCIPLYTDDLETRDDVNNSFVKKWLHQYKKY